MGQVPAKVLLGEDARKLDLRGIPAGVRKLLVTSTVFTTAALRSPRAGRPDSHPRLGPHRRRYYIAAHLRSSIKGLELVNLSTAMVSSGATSRWPR